ncbi:CfrBI family restriction endonuclease [Helicobacter pylori]|uniref:CfrBI family restriction endonuclease n=1 Tax=Helicobacter pylori TaxID=210 RepID=UPI00193263AA|nr:CfrBI family restriction endonuclease [Helicobacter pylori]MBM0611972.1 CfrBI family restriction endonuclease [Helicobacter pylori]MBM0628390.1 CfrBI family restriction endonuclease [Helicobacter pylori]
MNFNELALNHTIDLLLKGKDYREVVLNTINTEFLDFAISFFKDIVYAKMHDKSIDFSWYQQYVMDNKDPKDIAILCGTNIKTIFNTYGTSTKEVLQNLENDNMADLGINIKITYKDISVNLDLKESLLVINALATKKIALRGSAYSMIDKRIEKPLMLELCKRCGISESHIDATNFKKDKKLEYDREVDFKLYNKDRSKVYRVEVKLMSKGNPESADAVIARDTDIFIAYTLSEQNKQQLEYLNIVYLALKNNSNIILDFKKLCKRLDIPLTNQV